MIEKIREFYESTKLSKVIDENVPQEIPLQWTYPFYKEYPRLPKIMIPQGRVTIGLDTLLQQRESTRSYSSESMSLEEMGTILYSYRIVDSNRNPVKRTYPSAGARFPIEAYVISFNIEKLPCGVYHYNVSRECLEVLWEHDLRQKEKEITSNVENSAAAIILTSVISRSEVKYGVKAYPYSLIEVGHIAQNIQLTCAALNIGACSVGGFMNDAVSEILDLTLNEIPLLVIGLGKKKIDKEL